MTVQNSLPRNDLKMKKVKNMHELVRRLNKVDDNNHDGICGVCSEFVRRLTDFFYNYWTSTINSQCGELGWFKKNSKLTRPYGLMYLHFGWLSTI